MDNTSQHSRPTRTQVSASLASAYLTVWGMECRGCSHRVRDALLDLEGVFAVHIAGGDGMVYVTYDPARLDVSDLQHVVEATSNMYHYPFNVEVLEAGRGAAHR